MRELPMLLMGGSALLGSLLSLVLPETLGSALPERWALPKMRPVDLYIFEWLVYQYIFPLPGLRMLRRWRKTENLSSNVSAQTRRAQTRKANYTLSPESFWRQKYLYVGIFWLLLCIIITFSHSVVVYWLCRSTPLPTFHTYKELIFFWIVFWFLLKQIGTDGAWSKTGLAMYLCLCLSLYLSCCCSLLMHMVLDAKDLCSE